MALGSKKTKLGGGFAEFAKDRKEWRTLVIVQMEECDTATFAWFLCSFLYRFRSLVNITCRGAGSRYMMRLGLGIVLTENGRNY